MHNQHSVAEQPRQDRLAPDTKRSIFLSRGNSCVQVVVKMFDGLPLLVVDVNSTKHPEIRERCKQKLRVHHGTVRGVILVEQAERLRPLRLAHHGVTNGRIHPVGTKIATANLGRVVHTLG